MPPASQQERAIYVAVAADLRRLGHHVDVEYSITTARNPLRFRQIDLRVLIAEDTERWVEVDGPNHRGRRNAARDQELAALATEKRVVLLHWPLWRVLQDGTGAFVEAIVRGERDYGHAEPGRRSYRVYDSRYF